MKRYIVSFIVLSILVLCVGKSWGDVYYVNFAPNGTITQNPDSTSPANESPARLNDNTTSAQTSHSKWLVNNYTSATPYVIFSYDDAQALDAYALVTGNDYPEARQPSAWTIYGSNDQNDWTVLDKRTGYAKQAIHTADMFYVNTGELDSNSFKYFKFEVNEITGNTQELMQLSELQLYTMKQGTNLLKGGTITCTQSGVDVVPANATSENVGKLIDGSKGTKFCVRSESPHPSADAPFVITYTGTDLNKISAYALTSANDVVGRSPSKWTFSASADGGVTWDDLATQSTLFTETGFNQGFELAGNDTAYSSYRLTITQRGNDQELAPGDGAFQLAEMRLYGNEQPQNFSLKSLVNKTLSYDPADVTCWGDGAVSNLVDGNLATKWGLGATATPVTTPELYLSLGADVVLNSYTISAQNEAANLNRNPKSWTFYGQDATGEWIALDTQTDIQFYEGTDYTTKQTQTFSFANSQAFRNYKLGITANNGNTYSFQMSEFDVGLSHASLAPEGKTMINLAQHPAMKVSAQLPVGGFFGANGAEGLDKLFDGNTGTKMCSGNSSADSYITASNPLRIVYEFQDDLSYVLKSYSFTTANDIQARDPREWKVYGFSPAESAWILLDEESLTGDQMYPETRYAKWDFLLDNDNAWSKYAFEFTGTRSASSIFQISEMELWGYAGAHTDVPEPAAWLLLLGSFLALIPVCRRRAKVA